MIVGIILFAFAMRTTLVHPEMKLKLIPAVRPLLWLRALPSRFRLAPRWRLTKTVGVARPVAAVAFPLLIPAATSIPALAAVAVVAAVWICLHAYELLWLREERAQHRVAGAGDEAADV